MPALGGAEADAFELLFQLHDDFREGWALAGAQMVILHLAAHGIRRPLRTQDTDVLVDVRTLRIQEVVRWFSDRGFEPGPAVGAAGASDVLHEFRRGPLRIDVLSIDHVGNADLTSTPPAQTVEVPGGRHAINRVQQAKVKVGASAGHLLVPDWVGALLLKARAAQEFPADRLKHLSDAALLAALPVDIASIARTVNAKERRRVRDLIAMLEIDTDAWLLLDEASLVQADARVALTMLAG